MLRIISAYVILRSFFDGKAEHIRTENFDLNGIGSLFQFRDLRSGKLCAGSRLQLRDLIRLAAAADRHESL